MAMYFLNSFGVYYEATSDVDLAETVTDPETGVTSLRYPDKQDHTAVTQRPNPEGTWNGSAWVTGTPVIDALEVNAERTRRLQAGVSVTLSTGEVIALQGRDEDMRNLHGLCTAATLRLSQGDTTHVTTFRDRGNTDHSLTPSKVVELWSQGAAWVSSVYSSSWAIKDASPIPTDYTANSYWP